ncbi:MAG: glutaminyl-peptide cyclotransferase [Candidatus Marinimicrobia bacterium]|nr:glutaminyl-peptide cyclotransferase [Candidatus Neomarinimicrobiota bacterium]
MRTFLITLLVFQMQIACSAQRKPVEYFTYEVVNQFPHDENAFTQGLVYRDGYLYEGTGQYGESNVRKVELESGTVVKQKDLASNYFGEGITILNQKIYQLTWMSNTGFVYDLASFDNRDTFNYPTEGWGLTDDGESLIMSDGSANLYYLNPDDFSREGQLRVTLEGSPVTRINELEYINGSIYANIYMTDYIYRISPASGRVSGVIDLRGLLDDRVYLANRWEAVLNGIAYDQENDRLFVTGKLWPYLFEIQLIPQ